MALINCPACGHKVSSQAKSCSNCFFSFKDNDNEIERLKVLNYRKHRNTMYQFKMLIFVSIAIAVTGAVPMLWDYAKAIDYGFNVSVMNHWGIYLVIAGFAMYVIIRVLMLAAKRKYKATR